MSESLIGFIGLGNMGAPMAANIAAAGVPLVVYDAAGTRDRAPDGARIADSVSAVATEAPVILLSLPDGPVVDAVAGEIIDTPSAVTRQVVDTSTIGIEWAVKIHARLGDAGLQYLDAPVSGGVAGARAGTVSLMFAGPESVLESLRRVFEAMAGNLFHVGDSPGQGQAMKLLNNFLSGTAMAATSEAIAFGERQGLHMKTMLDVLNVSTGQNTATRDKFVQRILTGSYDAGFSCTQMNKDLGLYRQGLEASGGAGPVSGAVADIWRRFLDTEPEADITRIYPYIKKK